MSRTDRQHQRSRNNLARKLNVEPLEDRRMLAVLMVNSPLDNITAGDNLVTLREAVLAANNDSTTDLGETGNGVDTILFDTTVFAVPQTTLLALDEIEITEAVTIDATALPRNVTIDAQDQSRIFFISASTGDFTLAGLTLTGGRTTGNDSTYGGGAIRSATSGNLTIDRCGIDGNRTSGSAAFGGGVFTSGPLTLTRSTISNNETSGDSASGGGILAGGNLTVTGSTISGNNTLGLLADGGGIVSFGDLTINQSTITENSTVDDAGGIVTFLTPIEMTGSIVAGNTAGGMDPDIGQSSTLSVDYSLIGTEVTPDSGGNNIMADDPRLDVLADNSGPTMTHTPRSNSQAVDKGDPTIAFDPGEFDQRGAPFVRVADGGNLGLRIDMGATERQTLPASFFVVDTVADELDYDFSAGDVSLREAIDLASGSSGMETITFDTGVFSTPQTIALTLGQMTVRGTGVTIEGPGQEILTIDAQQQSRILNVNATGDVTVSGMTLTGGRATFDENTPYGGAIRWVNSTNSSTLYLEHCTVTGNSAARRGGAVFSTGRVTLTDSTVIGNTADVSGGGIHANEDVALMQSSISGNSAGGSGGGIFTFQDVSLAQSMISGNSAGGGNGGGISGGNVTLTGSTVSGNGAGGVGGGIFSANSATLTQSVVSGNSAGGDGGGINAFSAVTINQTEITGNSSMGAGGGIFVNLSVTLTQSTVSGNTTTGSVGGGIFATGILLYQSTFSENSAAERGGGVFATLFAELTQSTISGNTAAGGGGIHSPGVSLTQSTVSGNVVTGIGGGITFEYSSMITNSIVAGNTAVGGMNDIDPGMDPVNASYSLIEDTTGLVITGIGNVTGVGPQLAPLAYNGGPTQTHALLPGSPAIDKGDPAIPFNPNEFDQRGDPFVRVADGGVAGLRMDIGAYELQDTVVDGDFNDDGIYDCLDIDALVAAIATGNDDAAFDLTADGAVNLADRDAWLAEAGNANLGPGKVYLLGDANLDGFVDGLDYIDWNTNKFTSIAAWCSGDFNADSFVDGLDFIIWNSNKFQSSDHNRTVRPILALAIDQRPLGAIHGFGEIRRFGKTEALSNIRRPDSQTGLVQLEAKAFENNPTRAGDLSSPHFDGARIVVEGPQTAKGRRAPSSHRALDIEHTKADTIVPFADWT